MGVSAVCEKATTAGGRSFQYDPKKAYDERGRKRNRCYEPQTGLPIDDHCEVKEPSCSLNRSYLTRPNLYRYNYPCQVDVHGKQCGPVSYSEADFFLMHEIPEMNFKIRGSKFERQCECKMRNGLQTDCKRYSYGQRVFCNCLPLPEILKPAGQTSYDIVLVNGPSGAECQETPRTLRDKRAPGC